MFLFNAINEVEANDASHKLEGYTKWTSRRWRMFVYKNMKERNVRNKKEIKEMAYQCILNDKLNYL